MLEQDLHRIDNLDDRSMLTAAGFWNYYLMTI